MKSATMDSESQNLRQKAEALQKMKPSHADSSLSAIETAKLIHELEVHQIELELQNKELILARSSVQELAERYTELYDLAPSGYFTLSMEGEILNLNLCGAQFLGKERSQLTGSRFDLFISVDTRPIFNLFLDKVFQTKSKETCEVKLISNGDCPTHVLLTGISTENLEQCNVTMVDISERKRAEEAEQESKDFLDKIINSVASPIFVKDVQHRFCLVNDPLCSLLNLPVEKLIGTTGYEYIPEEQMKVFIAKDQEVFITGKENINEEKLTDGTGKIQNIVTQKALYTDPKGNKFLVGVINDITEIRKKEIELITAKEHAEECDRLKSAFLCNMSHEIRTPMNGILGFAELLKEPGLNGEDQQEYIRIIEKSGNRMLNIINDIVDISKIEAGLMNLNVTESNINEQIEYIYTFFKPEVETKGMKLSFRNALPAKEAIIKTDREKLYAILTNLVKNAIKYCKEGAIELGYERKGKDIEFFVKDTGIGIPKERQGAIFERFIQADIVDVQARQGAGLGLAISQSFVEMLGGEIWVESEEGIGSTFYFTLPYNTEPVKETLDQQLATSVKIDNVSKLKILIAEDDDVSEMLIAINIKEFGKEILKARTGVEAVEACRNNPDINLVLMDIRMPEMGGYEATRQIREFDKNVVIIAQTAYGLIGDREKQLKRVATIILQNQLGKLNCLH